MPRVRSETFTGQVYRPIARVSEAPVPVAVHSMLLASPPRAELDPRGRLSVTARSLSPVLLASAYFGVVPANSTFSWPRLRSYGHRRVPRGDPRRLRFEFEATRLMRPRYDVAQIRQLGRGVIHYRLELGDNALGTTRLFDGQIAFRCRDTPCAAKPRFVRVPAFVSGPFVDLLRHDGVTLSWQTDEPTHGAVTLIDAKGGSRRVDSTTLGISHEVELHGLAADTAYRYFAMAADGRAEGNVSQSAVFRTAPKPSSLKTPFRFAVLSDSRSGVDVGEASYGGSNRRVLSQHLLAAYHRGARLVIFPGDLIDGYTTVAADYRNQLLAWKRTVQPIAAFLPIYEGMGNHEALLRAWQGGWAADKLGEQSAEALFARAFVNPRNGPRPAPGAPPYLENVYSFDFANAHFVVLNSNYWFRSHFDARRHPAGRGGYREGWIDSRQLGWLDQDLAAARLRGQHLFVFTHEPSFPNGGHVADAMYYRGKVPTVVERRNRFWRVLVKHRVLAAFFGDEHNYSRTLIDRNVDPRFDHPIWAIISGGAGAPFYAQNTGLPWSSQVKCFSAQQHFVIVSVTGACVRIEAIGLDGTRLDRFAANAADCRSKPD